MCTSPWLILFDRYVLIQRGEFQQLSPLKMLTSKYKPSAYTQRFTIFILPNIVCQSYINPTVIGGNIGMTKRYTVRLPVTLALTKIMPGVQLT